MLRTCAHHGYARVRRSVGRHAASRVSGFVFSRGGLPGGSQSPGDAQGEFVVAGPAYLVEAQQFHHALAGAPPEFGGEQQCGDEREVDLEAGSAFALGEKVTAGQQAFEPAEELLDLPKALSWSNGCKS